MSKLVGLVGWRGMVGSVLMDRMIQEKDFDLIEPLFFSTSNAGGKAPAMAKNETIRNSDEIEQEDRARQRMNVIREFIEAKSGNTSKAGQN